MMLKNRWKKAACLILTIISTVCLGKVDVKAADYWPDAPETLSPSVILMEESTGTILYEKNMDEAHYPASITKIMTTLLALENGNLSDMVTFSDDAINNTEGSGIARDYGEQMTLEQCLYGVMLESANECAYAVAEHVGGTVENFVDMMNAKAKELGCTNTHFANPHGLQDENHYTTAHDMALIAQAAYQNETFRIIIGTKMYTIPPTNKHAEETVLRNHHDMLCTYHNANRKYLYPYCVGGKTGYTATANSTLVTYAEKDGMTLICVVMNTQSPNQFIDTVNLFDYAFDNFQVLNVAENDTDYSAETTVDNGNLNNIEPFVVLDEDNLCSRLQIEFDWGRQTVFGELALDVATEERWLARQELELVLIDVIHGVATGREGDGKFGITLVELGTHPLVEQLQVFHLCLTGADMVEDIDEYGVALAIHLFEFDAHELELLENLGIEEETTTIERIQQSAVVLPYHRL